MVENLDGNNTLAGFRLTPPMTFLKPSHLLASVRYVLPIFVIGIMVAAWYSDVLLNAFAHRPRAGDIAGSWQLDEAEYARMAENAAQSVPAGNVREKYLTSLLANANPYRGATFTFTEEGYTIATTAGEHTYRATYEGFPPNSLTIRPQNGKPMAVMIDAQTKHLVINLPLVGLPLSKVP